MNNNIDLKIKEIKEQSKELQEMIREQIRKFETDKDVSVLLSVKNNSISIGLAIDISTL